MKSAAEKVQTIQFRSGTLVVPERNYAAACALGFCEFCKILAVSGKTVWHIMLFEEIPQLFRGSPPIAVREKIVHLIKFKFKYHLRESDFFAKHFCAVVACDKFTAVPAEWICAISHAAERLSPLTVQQYVFIPCKGLAVVFEVQHGLSVPAMQCGGGY